MRAFHGKKSIKDKYLKRVRAHQKADQLIQGYGYWKDGKGCAVGCTIHGSDHSEYETELGIPLRLAWLEDRMFERIPQENARTWPERFLNAIPVGADLSKVVDQFLLWLLIDPKDGVIRFAITQEVKDAINDVANRYKLKIEGKTAEPTLSYDELIKLRKQCWSRYHEARERCYKARGAAAEAAAEAEAAAAAAAAAAWKKKRSDTYVIQSEKLLELLKNAPIKK